MNSSALTPDLIRSYAPDPDLYRSDAVPNWLDEVDLSVTDAHARMGTRSLREEQWLTYDSLARSEIALRRRLLLEQRQHVFACTPFADGPAQEVADLVGEWHSAYRPHDVALPDADEGHPLARVGSSIQEDLCVMVHHDGAWRLEGAMLCFPSLWILQEKVGLPTALVHAPVPFYAEELSQKVDRLFGRMTAEKMIWRRNVSVWPALILWAPCHTLDPSLIAVPPSDAATPPLWIRSERQTLRRLPETGAILFTIRVQTVPVAVLAHEPSRARDFAAWFRAPIGAVRRGQLGSHLDGLLTWLDRVGARD
jgi:hypothetical protein